MSSIRAGVSVSPTIAYYYGENAGESLSVSSDGQFIMVSSPVALTETTFVSSVPHLIHNPELEDPFHLVRDFDLGAGESTDVAIDHHGPFGLVCVRDSDNSTRNALLVIRGNKILKEVTLSARPDGMKITPDGRFVIVAIESGGEIHVYDLTGGASQVRLAAVVTKPALAAWFIGVPNPAEDIEAEAIGIAADSSFALVTLQDCASVASIDLSTSLLLNPQGLTPEEIGDEILKKVVHLPFGYVGSNGNLFGVEPDGVGISPDGSFAIVAHEGNQRAKHLQGLSVFDLRDGIENMTAQSYSIFDIDPMLLANTGLAAPPVVGPGDPYPTDANRLPRLDPASVKIVQRGGKTVAAFVIERYDPSSAQTSASSENETRGSVLFMDVENALDSSFPIITRVPVGVSGARLEVIDTAEHGRWVFVSISNGGGDRGTFARLELIPD